MRFLNTAMLRLSLVLLAGIGTGFHLEIPPQLVFISLIASLILFLAAFLRAGKLFLQDSLFGISCLLLFFFLGFASTHLHSPENQPRHYSNLLSGKRNFMEIAVEEQLKSGVYEKRFLAEVKKMDGQASYGKLLLLVPNDEPEIRIGELLLLPASLEYIPAPLNPQQFNYRQFMKNRGILYQTSLTGSSFVQLGNSDRSWKSNAAEIRTEIISKLKQKDFRQEEMTIIQALLLGQRKEISDETYQSYAAAGVIHILAVSGLHIGIILMILHWIFSPLERIRHGKLIKILFVLLALWSYALLAGLSPSVVRAVTMFSFVGVGMQLKRQTNVINALFLSLMLLVLVRPQLLLEIGFQLSYAAVFSIVVIQPKLYRLFSFRFRIIRYFWGLLSVTLAAQIGVLPLSLYYFHQFPGLFFLSNLVILPILGLILCSGFLMILLALLNALPNFLSESYSFLIRSLNNFVGWVAQQEDFIFQDIRFFLFQVIAFYALLTFILLLRRPTPIKAIFVGLGAIILLQGHLISEGLQRKTAELVVFHKSRRTVIAENQNGQVRFNHDLPGPLQQQSLFRNYLLARNIDFSENGRLENFYGFGKEILLVVDSTSIYPVKDLQPDKVLLSSSPKINLDRLVKQLRPKEIIADGSNYKSYIERWRATCLKEKIPFHYTGEKGSYIWRR